MGKIIVKGILVIGCAIALIWNAFQLKAIEDGTREVPIEYSKYSASDAIGQYREARIVGLYPIGTEEREYRKGNMPMGSFTEAYYCLALLDDQTTGAVKLPAKNGELVGYNRWLIEDQEDLDRTKLTLGFSVRGITTTMPYLDAAFPLSLSPGTGYLDLEQSVNDTISDITLLDTTVECPTVEKIVPPLTTLGNSTKFVVLALVVGIVWLGWDLLVLRSKREKLHTAETVPPVTIDFEAEVARIVSQCEHTETAAPELLSDYALCKLQYFKSRGAAEEVLQPLIFTACSISPALAGQNVARSLLIMQENINPLIQLAEQLAADGNLNMAYQITTALVKYAEADRRTRIQGKYSFRNPMEEALYRRVNDLKSQLNTASADYAGLFVLHTSLLRQLLHQPESRYLNMAYTLNKVNAGLYLLRAEDCREDPEKWKENIFKALEYCCNPDGPGSLARIYHSMGAYYQDRDETLSNACYAIGEHYTNSEAARMSFPEAAAVLQRNEIPVGYSQLVKDVAVSLPDQAGVQHILHNPGGTL